MKWYIHFFTKYFCKLTRPVIVPSEDFRNKLIQEMNLKDHEIVRLRRGINLESFHPKLRDLNNWEKFSSNNKSVKFLFVGRVSKEKELPFLEGVWREFRTGKDDIELAIVGSGPYLKEMQENLSDCGEVFFTGGLSGEELASIYAESDFFVFPSGTDTFGNVVVESLATGTPALVSNSGGPRMIVENKRSGFIIEWQNKDAWVSNLNNCYQVIKNEPKQYLAIRENAKRRSSEFSLEAAGVEWWDFYLDLIQKQN